MMKTLNDYCIENFGEKLYRLSLDGGMTCPNRDGTCGTGGCVFCSEGGSGDFAPSRDLPIDEQIRQAKERITSKFRGERFIAYLQAYTNTYAPINELRKLYLDLIQREEIAVLAIATRPDCLGPEVLQLLSEINAIKPCWVELGLQTVREESVRYIRRGYETPIYDKAVSDLNGLGIHTVTHVILGLPGESREDMLQTVRHAVRAGTGGIKLQLLHVLKGTDLAKDFERGLFETMSLAEYAERVCDCVSEIPEDVVIHRLTGDGPKRLLIAPEWSADKKKTLNTINRALRERGLL